MKSPLLATTVTTAALCFAFTVAFLVSPDPTGVLPFVVGAILTPVCYFGLRQAVASFERST